MTSRQVLGTSLQAARAGPRWPGQRGWNANLDAPLPFMYPCEHPQRPFRGCLYCTRAWQSRAPASVPTRICPWPRYLYQAASAPREASTQRGRRGRPRPCRNPKLQPPMSPPPAASHGLTTRRPSRAPPPDDASALPSNTNTHVFDRLSRHPLASPRRPAGLHAHGPDRRPAARPGHGMALALTAGPSPKQRPPGSAGPIMADAAPPKLKEPPVHGNPEGRGRRGGGERRRRRCIVVRRIKGTGSRRRLRASPPKRPVLFAPIRIRLCHSAAASANRPSCLTG